MSYELVASRILAPAIGTSIYVWTSVIGIMIAALAVGYAVGGRIADKRTQPLDIAWLTLACALTVTGTLVFYQPILPLVAGLTSDLRIQAIVDVILLFMPASFIMGMISSYLARLSVASVSTAGRSVANLSALNSVGGIIGTFCTGFVFFGLIGSRETLALLTVLLLATSWLVVPRSRVRVRVAASTLLVLATAVYLTPPSARSGIVATIDTPTANYVVAETTNPSVRSLVTSPNGVQSQVPMEGDKQLVSDYTQTLAHMVGQIPNQDRMLVLGGGAFALPEYLARTYPESRVDVVEIDDRLPQIAAAYFRYDPPANLHVFTEDARTYIKSVETPYDIVIVDVYHGTSVPFSLATTEYAHTLQGIVAPEGVVLANLVGSDSTQCRPLLAALQQTYAEAFASSFLARVETRPLSQLQNIIGVYAHRTPDWAHMQFDAFPLNTSSSTTLTDNFAPVERLQQHCV